MKQFRTVKRKAKVGERILITNKYDWEHQYKNGSVGEVFGVDVRSVFVQFAGVNAGVDHCEYEVIEEVNPKEEIEMTTKQLTDYSYEELLDAIKTKAQAEVKPKSIGEIFAENVRAALSNFNANLPALKTPQQQRDEIIEQAKRDVEELSSGEIADYYFVDFVVNCKKRTIVALIKPYPNDLLGAKISRGIAKCAPTDCFNAHIGKAIALRRALGLEVPSEYLTAPQPTEVRVGDVISWNEGRHYCVMKITGNYYDFTFLRNGDNFKNVYYDNILSGAKIIDDSREGE